MNQFFTGKNTGLDHVSAPNLRILVAPLDWGLGHATRCIPLIRSLINLNYNVSIAGEGQQERLLKAEFPELSFLQLPGYNIQYAKTKPGLQWKLLKQLPKMKKAIRNEHEWLNEKIIKHQFDVVISDNRYGLYHSTVPCIFITHQLTIKSFFGRWTERFLQKWNYKHINRFTACWVPDVKGENNFAGELSHPRNLPGIPVIYIGILSRLRKKELAEKKKHLLIILSGPEPQRSILENKIINEIAHYNGTATIVRGLPASSSLIPSTSTIKFYNHLSADEMSNEMATAEYVIGRSGYSTIMDIMTMKKKSIIIPTPGQTEQEYLAKYLLKKKLSFTCDQDIFSIEGSLQQASQFNYQLPAIENGYELEKIIATSLSSIIKK